ncbi:MAG: hypothetical protein HYR84_07385 [Planctomycetes bacterium]|nr:hypothetical protein [Planctomycetota bacterium]
MSSAGNEPPKEIQAINAELPDADKGTLDSLDAKGGEGFSEKVVDAIEMIGEEKAAGFDAEHLSEVTPGMRYLHVSRTIHQLVTDRNRAVGIYLAVASLLLTASGAIFHASPAGDLIIPIAEIQRWCLLPIGRVQRVSVLSIHFILQALISCAGGTSAAIFSAFMIRLGNSDAVGMSVGVGGAIGVIVAAALIALDIATISYTTSDERLQTRADGK